MLRINLVIQKVQTLVDGAYSLTVHTPELDTPQAVELFELKKQGLCAAVLEGVEKESMVKVDALDLPKDGKTPAGRLRAVLYKLWEHKGKEGFFEIYYMERMEDLINKIKEKLPPL